MISRYNFATRLALARALIERGAPAMPAHLADQLDAAAAEVREMHDRLGAVLPLMAPDRTWRHRVDTNASDDVRAYLLAAVLGCLRATCCHLRRGVPQPAFVRLPLHRIDCGRCAAIVRRPPPGEDDRCDLCGTRGVVMFHPFACRQGPALIAGDACSGCADVLGIVVEKVGA